jgi:hypothetical protein
MPLANRDVFQSNQEIFAIQIFHRHFPQYCTHSNINGFDKNHYPKSSESYINMPLAFIQLSSLHPFESVCKNKPIRWLDKSFEQDARPLPN